MTFVGNVSDDFITIGQPHLGDLAHGRIRLFWRARHDLDTDPATERGVIQGWRLGLMLQFTAASADQLIDCRHCKLVLPWLPMPGKRAGNITNAGRDATTISTITTADCESWRAPRQ